MRAVDCQGLAGAFTLGTVEAGFDLVAKVELPGGFGVDNCTSNRHLLGEFEVQVASEHEWEPYDGVAYVFGNPPCSGFSLMNTAHLAAKAQGGTARNTRGINSPINDCMWALVRYAARVNGDRGPEFLAMESVQQAYRKGRPLMQRLRNTLEELTRRRFTLTHVLMSGGAVGAAQLRKRYFMVLHADDRPFEVRRPEPRELVTYRQAISDLGGLEWDTWDEQGYRHQVTSSFQEEHRRPDGVVGDHAAPTANGTKHVTQVFSLLESGLWEVGEAMGQAALRYYERHGNLPAGFDLERIQAKGWSFGFHQPRRVPPDHWGYVITGAGGYDFVHWQEDRFLSVRECARLQGFPDDWLWVGTQSLRQAYAWIGKGVPVQSGRWLSTQVARSLQRPGVQSGELIGDREWLVDVTDAWRSQ